MIKVLRVFLVGLLAEGGIVKGPVLLCLLYQRHFTYRIAKPFVTLAVTFL
jgi:hypothetical protein